MGESGDMLRLLRRAALPQTLISASHCHSRRMNHRDTMNAEVGEQDSQSSVLSVTSVVSHPQDIRARLQLLDNFVNAERKNAQA